jgi:hypothetical protein
MASEPQKKAIIIVGDDGTLYQLSQDDLQAHKMAPGHPAYEHAQKLVEQKQHGTITPEHFSAQSATANTENVDIWFTVLNQGAVE